MASFSCGLGFSVLANQSWNSNVCSTHGIDDQIVNRLTAHRSRHTVDRHGPDASDEALIRRVNDGRAPNGTLSNNPPDSSWFDSPQQLESAFRNKNPQSRAFTDALACNPNQNPLQVTHTLNHGSNYGSGVIADVNNLRSQNSVRAFYSGKSETGAWELLTMYPEP